MSRSNQNPVYPILFTISFAHLINDVMQSVILAIYPLLKTNYELTFTQVGLITMAYQLTASLLQPFVGVYTDRKAQPYSLVVGMGFTLIGIIGLSQADNYLWILIAVCFVGLGSSIFHPESSQVANLASGGQRGLAQSIFQIGGNSGTVIGPLLVAFLVIPYGQSNVFWFAIGAIMGIIALFKVSLWYKDHMVQKSKQIEPDLAKTGHNISKTRIMFSISVLIVLIFSKYFYMASMTNYFTFYLIEKFQVSIQQSQFVYLLF